MQNYDNMSYLPPFMMRNQYIMPQTVYDTMQPIQYQIPNTPPELEEYSYPQNVPGALLLIQEALTGETEDRMFYQYLIENAPSAEDKEIIEEIRDDEIRHFGLFRQIYYELTGQTLTPPQNVIFEKPSSYCDGVQRALIGEQNAVRKYRRILYALQDRVQINILTGIITDEIRHGILYNYLYSKNSCRI